MISVGTTTAHALRVNFVGELGWEFHHPIEQQVALFDHLMQAGQEFGIRPYGIKAMGALSIEKSYRLVPRELSIEYSAYESGLDRFVHPNKGQFLGRDGLVNFVVRIIGSDQRGRGGPAAARARRRDPAHFRRDRRANPRRVAGGIRPGGSGGRNCLRFERGRRQFWGDALSFAHVLGFFLAS